MKKVRIVESVVLAVLGLVSMAKGEDYLMPNGAKICKKGSGWFDVWGYSNYNEDDALSLLDIAKVVNIDPLDVHMDIHVAEHESVLSHIYRNEQENLWIPDDRKEGKKKSLINERKHYRRQERKKPSNWKSWRKTQYA
jgi:hypothetical protein